MNFCDSFFEAFNMNFLDLISVSSKILIYIRSYNSQFRRHEDKTRVCVTDFREAFFQSYIFLEYTNIR